ncbi:ParB family chromosome partitioning protein [Roseibium hamelinense]|uniref:ParB family chromosome partitioning protein n=1 Tax=Roseibium hamelinense TaxID=150831 RepID=A0A562SNX3_9HYPH|nr:ParB/RepB/Spo0J family partition protein [Roseibium hamelinense]MTI43981.1 ParB/RepB/Spo0J family partition protein [Roseibium hamelinense]TWI82813.1 ParB family chromosome partitioning protein [Roseibium hamelinense]
MADEKAKNKRLGRGLAALIGDSVQQETVEPERLPRDSKKVPIEHLSPNPRNPRKTFTEKDLADLTESLKAKGIVQPILVRPAAGSADRYEIIAGERRWRAAQKAGLHEAPIIVRDVTDQEALELAIIENVQRADLNPIEEAMGYDQLTAEFQYSQGELAKVIGKSRSHVANTMRLLKLPNSVKDYLAEGLLTAGHARALITVDDPAALAELIVEKGLTVRDAEKLAQDPDALDRLKGNKKASSGKTEKDADTKSLEKRLSESLGLKVSVGHKPGKETGDLKIKYTSLEQLDELCRKLGVEVR